MNDMPITPNISMPSNVTLTNPLRSAKKLAVVNIILGILNLGLVVGNLLQWSDEQYRRNEIRTMKIIQQQHSEQINLLMHHQHKP